MKFCQLPRQRISEHRLIIALSVYFAAAYNLTFWAYAYNNIEPSGVLAVLFLLSLPTIVITAKYLLFNLVLLPYSFKPIAIFFMLIASAVNYFAFNFGVIINADMIQNTVETTPREAADLITFSLVLWVIISGVLPALVLARTVIIYPQTRKKLVITRLVRSVAALAVIALIALLLSKQYAFYGRNHGEARLHLQPENSIYAVIHYAQIQAAANRKFVVFDPNPQHKPYPDDLKTVIVLVLGETARTENFSLNGYSRNTNPLLSKQDVISFSDVHSTGTATAVSVPAIFSHKTREEYSASDAKYEQNMLDILQLAGWKVLWLENNDGCKGVCARVERVYFDPAQKSPLCDGIYCYDEIMLERLATELEQLGENTLIVLHQIGSHGPTYYRRYPPEFKVFNPTCDTAQLQECAVENIVNTYDNTIVYTDFVLSRVIEMLEGYPQHEAGMVYVSDHGESLGENGIYLHGLPYKIAPKSQKTVPLIVWMNEQMKKEDHIDYDCLRQRIDTPLSHDFIFHTMIGWAETHSVIYDPKRDFLDPCRTVPLPR